MIFFLLNILQKFIYFEFGDLTRWNKVLTGYEEIACTLCDITGGSLFAQLACNYFKLLGFEVILFQLVLRFKIQPTWILQDNDVQLNSQVCACVCVCCRDGKHLVDQLLNPASCIVRKQTAVVLL